MTSDKIKHTYKDAVFSMLFYTDQYAKRNLAELCNALHPEEEINEEDIQLVRLEQILLIGMYNDSAFMIKDRRIVLVEQQASLNWNMPLRMLLYLAREYEQLFPAEYRFKRAQIQLPKPEFITFYNGVDDFPQEQIMRLSDAFRMEDGKEQPQLELTARMININREKGHSILTKCPVLGQYSELVFRIRQQKTRDRAALEQIIKECIAENILRDFLERHSSEVINMLDAEYNYEEDIRVQRGEAWEEGREEGALGMLISLVQKGLLSIKDAAEQAGISEIAFQQKMGLK